MSRERGDRDISSSIQGVEYICCQEDVSPLSFQGDLDIDFTIAGPQLAMKTDRNGNTLSSREAGDWRWKTQFLICAAILISTPSVSVVQDFTGNLQGISFRDTVCSLRGSHRVVEWQTFGGNERSFLEWSEPDNSFFDSAMVCPQSLASLELSHASYMAPCSLGDISGRGLPGPRFLFFP